MAGILRCFGYSLGRVMIYQLDELATDPRRLSGTFLGLAYELLNRSYECALETAVGHVNIVSLRLPLPLKVLLVYDVFLCLLVKRWYLAD